MNIKDIVKNSQATFSHFKEGKLYYNVFRQTPLAPNSNVATHENICQFPIDVTDPVEIGSASFEPQYKAITLMRYIRIAMEDGSLMMFGPDDNS